MLDPSRWEREFRAAIEVPERHDENARWLRWLIRLRSVAVSLQALTVATMVSVLERPSLTVPLAVVLLMILVLANAGAAWRLQQPRPLETYAVYNHLGLDVAVLTGFLAIAGGPDNPFTALYLIHVAMAAVMIRGELLAALIGEILFCYAFLHFFHLPLHLDRHTVVSESVLRSLGPIVAFTLTVVSVTGFVAGLRETLRQVVAEGRDERPKHPASPPARHTFPTNVSA